jgi:hypothetical protein
VIAALDNDVVFKGMCYGLIEDICRSIGGAGDEMGVLGTARYVVVKKINRAELDGNKGQQAVDHLTEFMKLAEVLEPSDEEQRFAAQIEFAALQRNLALDAGESQLCSMVVQRGIPWLVTGDKRAIAAIEQLLDDVPRLPELCQRVKCLEQAILSIVDAGGAERLRAAICAEVEVDKALTNCFSCFATDPPARNAQLGLTSYITALRGEATRVLAD